MHQQSPSSPKSFAVLVIDMSHYLEDGSEILISGFPTRDEAIEYARRRVRSSVEELRTVNQSAEELRRLWSIYGEDALVIGENYRGSGELDNFIIHRATDEECNWSAIEKRLGVALHKGNAN